MGITDGRQNALHFPAEIGDGDFMRILEPFERVVIFHLHIVAGAFQKDRMTFLEIAHGIIQIGLRLVVGQHLIIGKGFRGFLTEQLGIPVGIAIGAGE